MDLNIDNIIKKKLQKYKFPEFETLKDNHKSHLRKIEKALQEISNEREKNLDNYKNNKITLVLISERTGISRQTFENNKKIVKEYILKAEKEQKKNDLFKRISRLKDEIKELEEEIRLLQLRDVSIQKLKLQNIKLTEMLEASNEEKNKLNEHNIKLVNKINKLKNKLDLEGDKVIQFNKK